MTSSSRDDLSRVAGPESMARPRLDEQHGASMPVEGGSNEPAKKKKRAGRHKRKNRRQSFAATAAPDEIEEASANRPSLLDVPRNSAQQSSFYRLQSGNRSSGSLESEALHDHREQVPIRSRRESLGNSFTRPSIPFARQRQSQTFVQQASAAGRSRLGQAQGLPFSDGDEDPSDRTPLLGVSERRSKSKLSRKNSGFEYGTYGVPRPRGSSGNSKASSQRRPERPRTAGSDEYDVNNPPSVPGSPKLGSLDDVMIAELTGSSNGGSRDTVIDIDGDEDEPPYTPSPPEALRRRGTVADLVERDVCFPGDAALSEIGEEDDHRSNHGSTRRRHRGRHWPNLEVLEEWSREEKEERTQQEHIRAKKISEPVLVGGRLRPCKTAWHREEDDAPFRFTYFNEMLDGTIHARTISDLLQDGATFKDLFLPDPTPLDSESEDESEDNALERPSHGTNGRITVDQLAKDDGGSTSASKSPSNSNVASQAPTPRPFDHHPSKRYGPRPTFWLDILNITEDEMKVIAKAFSIHQLTTEDILLEEPREKVELFQNYYFVNYRSFEQDKDNEDYMEPVNLYVVVFRDGVLTFHQSMTPHPANVRRRIRQLNDYMSPTADWISYAIIDDVTDVYAPLVEQIEEEVDQIDDEILYMHQSSADKEALHESNINGRPVMSGKNASVNSEKGGVGVPTSQADMGALKAEGEKTTGTSGGDMLRHVGECRKKVMGLYRLLGNKADVIKGFAKRCNEHWEVAPRSEIGLYLGDIQDHIVTMTSNLSHYENLLSRAHSNYLAQINIRMNERAEQTADVLGKLTVLGTIVLPMNIITGMWGMNVWVPGQAEQGSLTWFWSITAGLAAFALTCYFVAKKVYGIV